MATAPGWYQSESDPAGTERYWDGNAWTGQTRPAQSAFTDPNAGQAPGFQNPAQQPFGQPGAQQYGQQAGGTGFAPSGQYAPWLTRVLATLVDAALFIPVYLVAFVVVLILGSISDALGAIAALVLYLGVFGLFLYIVVFSQGQTGQTPGKRLMGIKVVSSLDDHSIIGVGNTFVRYLCHLLDGICYIGYLMPLWDSERQTIADKIMKTHVIEVPKGEILPIFPDGKPF